MGSLNHTFYIPGNTVGFKAGPRNRAATSKIAAFAEKVRLYARQACLVLPLGSDRTHPVHVETVISFQPGKQHADAENVHKLIKDILFYQGTTYVDKAGALCVRKHGYGQDRYTWGSYCYRYGQPGIIITISQNTKDISDRETTIDAEFASFKSGYVR